MNMIAFLNLNLSHENYVKYTWRGTSSTNDKNHDSAVVKISSYGNGSVDSTNMWVFGYGSLVWKVDFPIEYKITGHIKGFHRRFYQHSTDHRGTPENPGRVVTLIPSQENDACVWGVAYKIREADVSAVIDHLDYREKGGYQRKKVMFYPKDGKAEPFEITIYVGTSDNFQYAGEADLDSIAFQVFKSIGPSGSNIEYVCNLAKAMREIAPEINDDHLFNLERKVLQLIQNKGVCI